MIWAMGCLKLLRSFQFLRLQYRFISWLDVVVRFLIAEQRRAGRWRGLARVAAGCADSNSSEQRAGFILHPQINDNCSGIPSSFHSGAVFDRYPREIEAQDSCRSGKTVDPLFSQPCNFFRTFHAIYDEEFKAHKRSIADFIQAALRKFKDAAEPNYDVPSPFDGPPARLLVTLGRALFQTQEANCALNFAAICAAERDPG